MSAENVLVCFAVKEESAAFRKSPVASHTTILLTGMGPANARKAIESALDSGQFSIVITSGCAGALNPQLAIGNIVYDAAESPALASKLAASGAHAGRFYCSDRVATTAEEKWTLWQKTHADAVEMESKVIRESCRARGVSSVTIRAILNTAGENLPLDFNALMTPAQTLDFSKLALKLLKSPATIPALLRFQKQMKFVSQKLAEALVPVIA